MRWQIVFRFARRDVLSRLTMLVGAGYVVGCAVIDWAAGAALGGLALGFLLTLYAFTTEHFVMERDRGREGSGLQAPTLPRASEGSSDPTSEPLPTVPFATSRRRRDRWVRDVVEANRAFERETHWGSPL